MRLPAMAPAVSSCNAPSLPCSSANSALTWAYTGKYMAEKGMSLRKHALAPWTGEHKERVESRVWESKKSF